MTTSVVIPAFNGLEYLQKNLKSVAALGANEIIIVDDASADNSVNFIKENFPKIKLIQHSKNKRFPMTVNDGFAAASGEIIFLLNQDVLPDKNLIKNTLPHFKDDKVFAVTFNEQNRSWADGQWKDGMLEFKNGKMDDQLHESLWASGGSSAIRKSIWDQLRGFDTIFSPGYYEDLDLGLRARAAGYRIVWDPKCKVEHLTETAFNKAFTKETLTRIKERNLLLVVWKNLPPGQLLPHFGYLTSRIIQHPGYIAPVLWALWTKLVS